MSSNTIPEGFAAIEVVDAEGRPRQLGEVWTDRPAILLFLRHFG